MYMTFGVQDNLRAVFWLLSRPLAGEPDDGLITWARLKTVCWDLKVIIIVVVFLLIFSIVFIIHNMM